MELCTSLIRWNDFNREVHRADPDFVSIIICHYGKIDDFGEERAKAWSGVYGQPPNRSDLIRKCLTSLKENTDFPAEVIVIDNGGNPDDSDYLLSQVREGVINTYVRNKNNMHFGWAWNQGIALATSNTICLTCNDIFFKPQWLSKTMEAWRAFPNRKLIATPFISVDKLKNKNPRGEENGFRFNSMAGSNCMLLTKQIYFEVKPMTTYHIAGSHWHRRMNKLGYLVVAPKEDMAEEMSFRQGLCLRQPVRVKEDLLNKQEIDFSFILKKK